MINVGEKVEKREPLYTIVENGAAIKQSNMVVPQKLNYHIIQQFHFWAHI